MITKNGIKINSQTIYIEGRKIAAMWIHGMKVYSMRPMINNTVAHTVDFTDYDELIILDGVLRDGFMEAATGDIIKHVNIDFTDYDELIILDGVLRDGFMEVM